MIKNKLTSLIGKDQYNDDVELNNVKLKYDGTEYLLAPGAVVDLMKVFPINKDQVGLLEARFTQKFPAALKSVDTQAEEDKVENARAKSKKDAISVCLTQKAVKELIKGEKNADVITYAMDKIEELSASRKT